MEKSNKKTKKKTKKNIKKHVLEALIPIVIIGGVALAILYSNQEKSKKVFEDLDVYSEEELDFLEAEGFLPELKVKPETKEEAESLLKSPGLIEQNLGVDDENFEVLASKLDLEQDSYQLAFKLENKSNEQKEFNSCF